MGLDITFYSKLTPANGNEGVDEEGEVKYEEGWFRINVNSDFPGRADPLVDLGVYKAEGSGGFHAGGYMGYNRWRDQLAEMVGWPKTLAQGVESFAGGAWVAQGGPFWELINFTDCDGTLGSIACKKLARDFEEFQSLADNHSDEMFRFKYAAWRNAFRIAANDGAVVFC